MRRRFIWIRVLIIGLVSNLFLSCIKQDVDKRQVQQYIFNNLTEHLISIEMYQGNDVYNFELPKRDSLVQEIELVFGSSEGLILYADSIKIEFDDLKEIKYLPSDESYRNLLHLQSYDNKKIGDVLITRYSFLEEDYQNAEVIEED
ncbi:hypothetical protein [Echinicola strongylocentroti]|nr:hypothetical protein [Echinicola strongylocentroti]